ncbi:c-type cytochrome [Mucilaginibacter segetis]|uniref:C-type cytochrome n=1 Tax=Mucilaginibacter segetis TaxID=2793071 RepID=A0A934UPL3_9SPHI|nr:c-type cytochrome [Mucilaginibacter segetis]MBK0381006.1 c-type cytochrome [Mucilaginibacter segetis]
MKKIFVVLGVCLVIAACGGNSNTSEAVNSDSAYASNQTATAQQSSAANDTAATKIGINDNSGTPESKGAQLMANNDCNTCHKPYDKVIGPAFVEIAKKYSSSDEETLAKKVIAGGSGNWGNIAMTPHPSLSMDDAKEMVKYILSVK